MKIISTKVHGAIDYLAVGTLLALPHAMGWSANVTRLLTASALRTLAYSLLTQYEFSALRLLPMKTHLKLDGSSGLMLALAALFIGDARAKKALVGLGLFELATALLSKQESDVQAGSGPLAPLAAKAGLEALT